MNVIWTTLMIAALVFSAVTGPEKALSSAIGGATSAVSACLSLAAVYCFWNGIFSVLEKSRWTETLAKATRPLVKKLYGKIDETAAAYIALNMSANLLGVSNAATPSAQKAIEILEKDNVVLSRAGALLFVLNATSIQILPTTVIGMRANAGSVDAADILLPTFLSTAATTLLGVLLVRLAYGRAQK